MDDGPDRVPTPGDSPPTEAPATSLALRRRLIALHAAPDLSRSALCRLAQDLPAWTSATEASEELAGRLGVPRSQLRQALAALAGENAAAAEEEGAAARAGGRLITLGEPAYPRSLTDLALPPPVLAVRGRLPDGPAVAIVGSRKPDSYGLEAAGLFARALAGAGVAVVSGLARGIDAAAHRAALAAGEAGVGVLGCGLAIDYPPAHRRLAARLAAHGAVVSELHCSAPPLRWHFPIRNRIIAALASGVLVVQAAARSGSLGTARYALDLGRDVFAIPGRIFDELSLGTNALIRDGAIPLHHPDELLDHLGLKPPAAPSAACIATFASSASSASSDLPTAILALLAAAPQSAESLARHLVAELSPLFTALLDLELAGRVERRPGGLYTAVQRPHYAP
jgi:DNA processing protein